MAKGGARARSGPAPDPMALRRERDAGEWTILPQAGREGPIPEWPLVEASDREQVLWADLWRKPQALMWERYGQQVEVALYVRRLAETEVMEASVNRGTLVRQMADSLGLTTPGLRANRWRIGAVEEQLARPDQSSSSSKTLAARSSSRTRLRVVSGEDGD